QRMQVVVRSSTSARPRAASPGLPVSESGMPSPTTWYGAWALAPLVSANATANKAIWSIDLAKGVRRDRLKPFLRVIRLAGAQLARGVDGTGGAALNLGEDVVLRLVIARERETVAGCDDVVADAGQPWRLRRDAGEQALDRCRAGAALRDGGRGRFWNAA